MKLKTIEVEGKTYAAVEDGKPVYVEDDGKELPFDVLGTRATISRLNGEAKTHRERAEAAEGRLKLFDGIEDPEVARKALDVVKNLDDKKLVDAGEVERVKAEVIKSVEAKYQPIIEENSKLKQDLHNEKIGGSFARSKFIADRLVVPPDLIQARFGAQFKIEEGKIVAYDTNGQKLFSRANPGELASFEEALESMVMSHPAKDSLLKAPGSSGSGAPGARNGGGASGDLKRSKMDATAKAAYINEHGQKAYLALPK